MQQLIDNLHEAGALSDISKDLVEQAFILFDKFKLDEYKLEVNELTAKAFEGDDLTSSILAIVADTLFKIGKDIGISFNVDVSIRHSLDILESLQSLPLLEPVLIEEIMASIEGDNNTEDLEVMLEEQFKTGIKILDYYIDDVDDELISSLKMMLGSTTIEDNDVTEIYTTNILKDSLTKRLALEDTVLLDRLFVNGLDSNIEEVLKILPITTGNIQDTLVKAMLILYASIEGRDDLTMTYHKHLAHVIGEDSNRILSSILVISEEIDNDYK